MILPISKYIMGEDFLIRYLKNWKYGGFFPKKLIEHACLLGSSEYIQNEHQGRKIHKEADT